jgi:hypothetical protein
MTAPQNPGGWRCLRCGWEQAGREPEPEFAPKGCECGCWDFQCPACGGAVAFGEPAALTALLKAVGVI